MQGLMLIVALSLAVEGLIEYFTPTFPMRYKWLKPYLAAIVSVLLCLGYSADLFVAIQIGAARYPWIGQVLTGLIIGRGSNFLAAFYKRIKTVPVPSADIDRVAPRAADDPPMMGR